MVIKPLGGWGADRVGRRPIMLAGAALFAVSPVLYGWSHTVGALLGVRLLHGAGMGLYPAAGAAMVADLSATARRGEAMGFWGAAGSVALALGPLCSIWIVDGWGFAALFHVCTGIAVAALLVTVAQRETRAQTIAAPFTASSLLSRAAIFPCVVVFCLMTTYGAQVAFLAIYAQSRGENPGIFFLVMALVIALARGYAGVISDRVGRAPVAAAGLTAAAGALIMLAAGDGIVTFGAAGALYGLGLGSSQPALMAWVVDLVGPEERGKAMGTFYAAYELGIASGAVGFGAVLARASFPFMFLTAAAMALAAAALAGSRWRRLTNVHPHTREEKP